MWRGGGQGHFPPVVMVGGGGGGGAMIWLRMLFLFSSLDYLVVSYTIKNRH